MKKTYHQKQNYQINQQNNIYLQIVLSSKICVDTECSHKKKFIDTQNPSFRQVLFDKYIPLIKKISPKKKNQQIQIEEYIFARPPTLLLFIS